MASSSDSRLPAGRQNWGEVGRAYVNTTLFCLAIDVTLWLLELANPFWASLAVSFSIGYSTATASIFLQPLFLRFAPPLIASVITTVIGAGFGVVAAGYLILGDALYFLLDEDYSTPVLALFFGIIGLVFFSTRARLVQTSAALADARAEQLTREKAHLETELKLLQAQIEPHFLFNTLSNVVGMIRDQPEAAEQTLIHLTTLLRSKLQRTRREIITLGDELTIIEALLTINRIRMGERLEFTIRVPDHLRGLALPPMLLQPLVENALKHGIEPLEEGGKVEIEATLSDGQLSVAVIDTGVGLDSEPNRRADNGTGVGIANVQSRLAALYGDSASLTLEENQPHGLIARLVLPETQT